MTERERVLEEATNFCFYSDTPLGEVSHEQIHNLMADFHLAQSAEITAERDRLREALKGIRDMPEYDQDDAHRLRHGAKVALTAYLTGKGDGDKGE